jgi:hypothetical protein
MTFTKTSSILAALALVLALVACAPSSKSEPQGEQPTAAAESSETIAPPAAEEVSYEPAYPEEVSDEALTAQDVEQQEAGHSHGQGTKDHTHEDGTTHSPDDGDDQHQH